MENKNEFTQNSTQSSKHPAEKLMQYPIDSDSDGIPKKVVRNPELAEEFAYAEKPYRELAIESENQGLDDEAAAILRRGRVAVQRMGIEGKYYSGYETTRNAVRSAIAKDDPAWLNPYHSSDLAVAKYQAEQEALRLEIEKDRPVLADQRRYARALVGDDGVEGNIVDMNRNFSGYRKNDSQNYKRLIPKAPESDFPGYADEIFSDNNLNQIFLKKRRNVFNVLKAANSWRDGSSAEKLRAPVKGLDDELNSFFKDVYDLHQKGSLTDRGAKLVLEEFDSARYSLDDFRTVADKIHVSHTDNSSYYKSSTNLPELLERLYLDEPHDDILAERAEWADEAERKKSEQKEKERAYREERSIEAKAEKEARDTLRHQEILDKFQEANADFIAGRNATKQKILDSPVGGDVAPMLEQDTSTGSYEAVYPNVRALKAALALFTVKRSEEFSEDGHLVPYTGLDIDSLWREKFVRPKGYYGGETGQARLTIRKPADDESVEVNRQLNRLDSIDKDEAFVVDITIEGVKGSEVQMTSTLEGILYTVPDATLPLVRRFAYRPFESTATGDPRQFQLEKLAAISRARRQTGEAMANPLRGGLPGLGRKR